MKTNKAKCTNETNTSEKVPNPDLTDQDYDVRDEPNLSLDPSGPNPSNDPSDLNPSDDHSGQTHVFARRFERVKVRDDVVTRSGRVSKGTTKSTYLL